MDGDRAENWNNKLPTLQRVFAINVAPRGGQA